MDTKCTAHGQQWVFASVVGGGGGVQIGVAIPYHSPPFHETRLKSALGLRCTNAIKNKKIKNGGHV